MHNCSSRGLLVVYPLLRPPPVFLVLGVVSFWMVDVAVDVVRGRGAGPPCRKEADVLAEGAHMVFALRQDDASMGPDA